MDAIKNINRLGYTRQLVFDQSKVTDLRTVGEFYATYHRLRAKCANQWMILTHPAHPEYLTRKKHVLGSLATVFTFAMTTAAGVVPHSEQRLPITGYQESIELPGLDVLLTQATTQHLTLVRHDILQAGDTLSALFHRLGIQDSQAEAFIRSSTVARYLLSLKSGQAINVVLDRNNTLKKLSVILPRAKPILNESSSSNLNSEQNKESSYSLALIIERLNENQFETKLNTLRNELEYEMRSGTLNGDFFVDMDGAEVPDEIVEQMLSIFSGVIDFHHDIQRGDRFRIVYESVYHEGGFIRHGRIVAVELLNHGRVHQAIWYGDGENGDYYTFDGRAMRRAFLRAPIAFSRLSSGFGGRQHPIFGEWRQHNGVDFAAPVGTRVFAAGDGVVEFSGWRNGYGNVVILRHRDGYSTYYAHLSGFDPAIKPGQRVRQGETVGQVGSTGWATGPHLHYEFRYHDVPIDPLKVVGINNYFLAGKERQQFASYTASLLKRIHALRSFNVAATTSN